MSQQPYAAVPSGPNTPAASHADMPPEEKAAPAAASGGGQAAPRPFYRSPWVLGGAALLVVAAVAIPVGIVESGASSSSSSKGAGAGTPGGNQAEGLSANPDSKSGAWYGAAADAETMTAEDGSTFVYNNSFGGTWNALPFNDSARANALVPPLNEPWGWGVTNRIHGVNIGGWLVTEPFIVPSLYEQHEGQMVALANGTQVAVVDEWTLMLALGSNASAVIEDHYDTFITEKDFANIASAGLNWVRIPIGYWAIETWEDEPFLEGVAWKYFLKAISWARKYGIRINLDLHAVPGSQNGQNHSGRQGQINFLRGVMGIANAQRTLNYIRTLTEFISQPEYTNVIQLFSILNEPQDTAIGQMTLNQHQMGAFYLEAYNIIRGITGVGEGKGPMMGMSDGFESNNQKAWYGFLQGSDRIAIDTHSYFCFQTDVTNKNYSLSYFPQIPCTWFGTEFNTTYANYGFAFEGEFSLAVVDCGQYINGVGKGTLYEATLPASYGDPPVSQGSCDVWNDVSQWTQDMKDGLKNLAMAQQDVYQNWFFWTWKIGNTTTGLPGNPLWSYSLGLQEGYIPEDPSQGMGWCQANYPSYVAAPFTSLQPWMTGGAGAGTIAATASSNFTQWPPASLTQINNAAVLATFAPTGKPVTLSAATPTIMPSAFNGTTNPGDGWADASDTSAGWYTSDAGCTYTDAWNANLANPTVTPTASACSGGNGNSDDSSGNGSDSSQQRRKLQRRMVPTPRPLVAS